MKERKRREEIVMFVVKREATKLLPYWMAHDLFFPYGKQIFLKNKMLV
jgi:hypothetical protein